MSNCVSRLHLERPPVTIHKAGSIYAPLWRAECGECGTFTKPDRLLSIVLAAAWWCQDVHVAEALEAAAAYPKARSTALAS